MINNQSNSVKDYTNLNMLHSIRKNMQLNPELFDQISLCINLIWVSGEIEEIERGLSVKNEKAAGHGDLDVNDFGNVLVSSIPLIGQAGKEGQTYA